LTQAQFAESINVKQQAISRFEKGEIDARISFIAKVVMGMKKKMVFSNLEAVQVEKTITRKKKEIDMLKTS
jgi:predicted transcriptional regulator